MVEVIKKSDSEIKNRQQIVPVEINSDMSEDENNHIQSQLKALPSSYNFSDLLTKIMGAIMQNSISPSVK